MIIALLSLKAKICGFEYASKKLCRLITRSKGKKKQSLRFKKHQLGVYAREHMVAYGILRKKSYEKIEPKCNKDNPLNKQHVLEIVHQHVPSWEIKNWTLQSINEATKRCAK